MARNTNQEQTDAACSKRASKRRAKVITRAVGIGIVAGATLLLCTDKTMKRLYREDDAEETQEQ